MDRPTINPKFKDSLKGQIKIEGRRTEDKMKKQKHPIGFDEGEESDDEEIKDQGRTETDILFLEFVSSTKQSKLSKSWSYSIDNK